MPQSTSEDTVLNSAQDSIGNEILELKNKILTPAELTKVQDNLNQMIDVMTNNPSWISVASRYWGDQETWKKILLGIVLIVPTMILGVLAGIGILIATSIFTLISYTASSIILDEHYNNNTNTSNNLKSGINGLANMLGTVVMSLETLHEHMEVAVENFKDEITNLEINVESLGEQINSFSEENQRLQSTVGDLTNNNAEFANTVDSLHQNLDSAQEQLDVFQTTVGNFERIVAKYEQGKNVFVSQVTELKTIVADLEADKKQKKAVIGALEAVNQSLTEALLGDVVDRKLFLEKLTFFIHDEKASFSQITARICEAERLLDISRQEYDKLNKEYEDLLKRMETSVVRLENNAATSSSIPLDVLKGPGNHGIFPPPSPKPHDAHTNPTQTLQ